MAAPLVIAATGEVDGTPWGFNALCLTSVSLDPAPMPVRIPRVPRCHGVMTKAEGCAAEGCAGDFLSQRHRALVQIFVTPGADRFAADRFGPGEGSGRPFLLTHQAEDSMRLPGSRYQLTTDG
ncbi:hypothetical protein [Streptomyces sp. NPDC048428]|uniref:hypothetical protein n=1 Tax=Streptomyces sp. NPDC048428 TaxID=3154503 RepID=UPI003413133C